MQTQYDAIDYQAQEQSVLSGYASKPKESLKYQNNSPKTYRLAKDGAFQVIPFGPLMTLAKAESYRDDLSFAFPNILVINTASQ